MMKLGIALGGGGAKGFAHLGVLHALEHAQIDVAVIAGTSAGAIIGALSAAGKTSDQIERRMRQTGLRQWLARDRTGMGLFSTDGIRRVIEAELGAHARIENLPRPFAAVAVEMESQREVVFTSGLVADAVCASCSFPAILAPTLIGGLHYLDGGLLNQVPFDVARALGADRVIAVDLAADEPIFSARDSVKRPEELLFQFIFTAEQQKIFRVAARAISIMTQPARALKLTRDAPDVIVRPAVQSIGLIDFDLLDQARAAGTAALRAALPSILALRAPSVWERLQKRIKIYCGRMV